MENGIAKYYLVKEEIYGDIKKDKYRVGSKLPGERKIAQKYNVSHMTARQAISNLVEEGLLSKEQGRGTFVIRKRRDSLPFIQNNFISVFLPAPGGKTFFSYQIPVVRNGVLEAVYDKVSSLDFHTNVIYFKSPKHLEVLLHKLIKIRPKGVVIWYEESPGNKNALQELHENEIKFVLVDRYSDIPFSYVVTDNFYGGYKMTEYLIKKLNHKNILYITPDLSVSSLTERVKGYTEAMQNNNLNPEISVIHSAITMRDFEKLAKKIIQDKKYTCIFASNDGIAIKLIRTYEKFGVKIPEEISIAGYDDIDISSHLSIPLTTVKQDFYKMGEIATEILLNWEDTDNHRSPRQIKIKPVIKIRKSATKNRR